MVFDAKPGSAVAKFSSMLKRDISVCISDFQWVSAVHLSRFHITIESEACLCQFLFIFMNNLVKDDVVPAEHELAQSMSQSFRILITIGNSDDERASPNVICE